MPQKHHWRPTPKNLNKYSRLRVCGPCWASAAEPRLPRQPQMPHPYAQALPCIATYSLRHPQAHRGRRRLWRHCVPRRRPVLPLCSQHAQAQAAPPVVRRVRLDGAPAPARSCVAAGVFFPFLAGAAVAGAAAGGAAVVGALAAATAGADAVAGFNEAGLGAGGGRESK